MTNEIKTDPKPAAKPASVKPGQRAMELIKAITTLPPEEQEIVGQHYGIDFPSFPSDTDPSKRLFGYRCDQCGKIDAIEFVGDKFKNSAGQTMMSPPADVPIHKIPWVTDRGPYPSANRAEPRCQWCGNRLHFLQGQYLAVVTRLIHIETWTEDFRKAEEARRAGWLKPVFARDFAAKQAGLLSGMAGRLAPEID